MSITLDSGAEATPEYTREVAGAAAEAIHVLNHLTAQKGAFERPADVDAVIGALAVAVSRLPQLFDQIATWLAEEALAGRVRVAGGRHDGRPAASLGETTGHLQLAIRDAGALHDRLHAARQLTADMSAA